MVPKVSFNEVIEDKRPRSSSVEKTARLLSMSTTSLSTLRLLSHALRTGSSCHSSGEGPSRVSALRFGHGGRLPPGLDHTCLDLTPLCDSQTSVSSVGPHRLRSVHQKTISIASWPASLSAS